MNQPLRILICVALFAASSGAAFAQSSGPLGSRTIKSYWIEGGAFLAVTPTVPFDNPTGCTQSTLAIVPATHAAYKQMLAAVNHAMATSTPISMWATGCYSSWGQTFP
jgi:K+-transporting ATPase A subunit